MADRGVDPLSLIQVAVEKLDSKLDKTNDKVDGLTEIVSKQAVLFERLANFEINSKESINRIHERIDKHSERIEQLEEEVKYLNNAPTRALGKIGASILAVFGAGIGGWLLLKFGLELPK